jgi:hypothetical protein
MNKNLESYIKIYRKAIDLDFCKKTISELNSLEFEEYNFYDKEESTLSKKDPHFSFDKNISIYPELLKKLRTLAYRYIIDLNCSWYTQFQSITPIKFNRYIPSKELTLHCDHIHSIFDGNRKGIPIFSIVGLLNDDFEGGRFTMFDNDIIDLSAGDVLIFPSNFLYPHRVFEITKGVRYSFVSWVY